MWKLLSLWSTENTIVLVSSDQNMGFNVTQTMWKLTHRQTILSLWFLFCKSIHVASRVKRALISHHFRHHMKEGSTSWRRHVPWLYVPEENGFSHLSDTTLTVIIQHRSVKNEHPFAFTQAVTSYRWLSMNRADADHRACVKSPLVQSLVLLISCWLTCRVKRYFKFFFVFILGPRCTCFQKISEDNKLQTQWSSILRQNISCSIIYSRFFASFSEPK